MTLALIALYTFVAGLGAGVSVGQALPGFPFITRWERISFVSRACLFAPLWPIRLIRAILRAMEAEGRDGGKDG